MQTLYTYRNGRLEEKQGGVVREFPLALQVNGREIATLVASPHDLRYLVAGFLRLQGFVQRVEDFHLLAICDDYGIANVQIRRDLPEQLKPVLTSGCGTGIVFSLPAAGREPVPAVSFSAESVFVMMEMLHQLTERYRRHGGIHSAAVGNGDEIVLHAEDIGRHNTLDRIAGEALLKGIDLSGMMLVTSGRISTEMAAKAASLGISLIASRTSPTDLAVRLCESAGICLAGYVRGAKFNLYANAGMIRLPENAQQGERLPVTAAILAGGESSRMGSNKALLPYKGGRFIEAIHRQLAEIFQEVILVTSAPEQYDFLPCRKVPDLRPGFGALSGIHSALRHSTTTHVFVTACDMPYLQDDLIRRVASDSCPSAGVVIPETAKGLEPLHALYGTGCIPFIEETLGREEPRIVSFFDSITVVRVPAAEIARLDPEGRCFRNINTPQEYFELRDQENGSVPGQETPEGPSGTKGEENVRHSGGRLHQRA